MQDHHALKLTHALRTYDLDTLVPLIQDHLHWPPKQLRSNLKPVIEQAQLDHINLLHPPPDYHTWLQTPLRTTVKGPNTAAPTTINARLTTLSRLYEHLIDHGLILQHPLRNLERPPSLPVPTQPPPHDELTRLLLHAQSDPHLHAALLLLTRHGLFVTELLALRWPHLDYPTGTLLRKNTTITLDHDTFQALDHLLAQHGGPLHTPEGRVFPYQNLDALRTRLFQVTREANLPFISPTRLRKLALLNAMPDVPAPPVDERLTGLAETLAEQKTLPKPE